MLSRSPNTPARLSQRAHARRRVRRNAGRRLFCSTNGCATYLVPEAGGRQASCPICGLRRTISSEAPIPAGRVIH